VLVDDLANGVSRGAVRHPIAQSLDGERRGRSQLRRSALVRRQARVGARPPRRRAARARLRLARLQPLPGAGARPARGAPARSLAANDARRARAPPPHLPPAAAAAAAAAAAQAEARGAAVARLNATDAGAWAPELLALGVDAVPCALLVDARGRALCRTPPPRSAPQMTRALAELIAAAGRGGRAAAA
jgi:hypothetical protein